MIVNVSKSFYNLRRCFLGSGHGYPAVAFLGGGKSGCMHPIEKAIV